jgi:uncharacterized membrane protein YdbT with pleckstrin-like domain
MAFPKDLLAEHEKVVFDIRPHWLAALPSLLWTLVLAGAWAGGYSLAKATFDDPTVAQNVVAVVVLIAWVGLALVPFLRWRFTMFVLTSDRLITRSGVLAKHSKEIPLERINDVAFSQSVLERALGAGDLMIESAGERGQTVISNVRKPEEMQLLIYKESEENSNRMFRGGADPARPGDSVVEQIEALGRLKEQGVLSAAEFEAKKKELLDRL